jgi:hypothetical protein
VSYEQTGGSLADLFDPELAALACREMAEDASRFATETARELAPISNPFDSYKRAPGSLKDSYRERDVVRRARADGLTEYEGGVESFDPVARWVEYGVQPHTIEAKNGPYITFRSWPTGEIVRARVVHQRGYPGQHVVSRALLATELAFDEVALPALERWQRRQQDAARR